jgi:hypothetical protein
MIFLIASCAAILVLAGCSAMENAFSEPIPGVFYRVTWEAPPPDTICREAAEAISEMANFNLEEDNNNPAGWRCLVSLRSLAGDGQRPIRITLLAARSVNFLSVGVQEFTGRYGSITKPSQSTTQLANSIRTHLQERFPAATVARYQAYTGLFGP